MNARNAYVLAAGHGRRAGGPKAWREYRGRPMLARQLDFLIALFAPPALAASIQPEWAERVRRLHAGVRWVAVDPDVSPLASLQALLRAAPPTGWFFLHHVDMPVFELELFHSLDGAVADGVDAIVPVREDRGGHPVLLSPALVPALLALDPAVDRLDAFLRARKTKRVPVAHDCIHANLNTG